MHGWRSNETKNSLSQFSNRDIRTSDLQYWIQNWHPILVKCILLFASKIVHLFPFVFLKYLCNFKGSTKLTFWPSLKKRPWHEERVSLLKSLPWRERFHTKRCKKVQKRYRGRITDITHRKVTSNRYHLFIYLHEHLDWSRQGCVWLIRQFIIWVHSLTSVINCCLSVK